MHSIAVRRLFEIAVALPEPERRRVLDDPTVPADVRADVESLLAFDAAPDLSLTSAISNAAVNLIEDRDAAPAGEWGPYRKIRLIGTGGMSAVYLAERADGEVQQRAAVKVLSGAGRRASIERFLQERQLLANMNHPGIARLLDAGRTIAGEPYLVMELVEGVPIDEYAATIDVRDRFELFLRVCDAVSYAHRHLVIHRDIKPSNILVDASGQPKLLDFGIAKLLDAPGDLTNTVDRWLTPNYASPEQRRGEADTTATDVYSLGAVLHTILTGAPPRDTDADATGPLAAAGVPGDAGYILRKALRAEPAERYASVDALANDIRALLEWRPVQARADDRWYRARRWLRRHRTAAALVAVIAIALSVGFFAVNRERAAAERRFQQVRQLANQVLALDAAVADVAGATKARQGIVAISKEYLEALEGDAGNDPALSFELGTAYVRLARAQGVPSYPNLGMHAAAGESLAKAETLMHAVLRASPGHDLAHLTLAEVSHDLMILADRDRNHEAALAHARAASDRLETFLGRRKTLDKEERRVVILLNNVALVHKNLHRYDDSVKFGRRTLEIVGPDRNPEVRGSALSLIADSLRFSGDLSGALAAITEARETMVRASSTGTSKAINQYGVLFREGVILGGDGQISLERSDDAVAVLQQAFDSMEQLAALDANDATSRIRLGSTARELGAILRHDQPARALRVYEHAMGRLREIANNVPARRSEAQMMAASAEVLRRVGRPDEARVRVEQAVQILRDTKTYPAEQVSLGDETETILRAWGDHLAETGELGRAAGVFQELLEKVKASHPDPERDLRHATGLSRLYEASSRLNRRLNRPDLADSLAKTRLEMWRAWSLRLPQSPFVQKQLRAASFTESGAGAVPQGR